MHVSDLLLTIAGGLTAALALGLVTERLRLSPIVGYLIAGILVGPHTPGFVANYAVAEQFAEVGIILLMFGVGLHFRVDELLAVRGIALPGALLQILVATALGTAVTHVFGWSLGAGVVFGLAISVASTVVLVRVLTDHDALHTPAGHVAVGWLIVEDIFTVIVLVLLPIVAAPEGAGGGGIARGLGEALGRIAAVVLMTFWLGRKLVPKLLGAIAKTRSRELFTLGVLVLAVGVAVGSAALFGVSMALGAFLAGMVVGQSQFSFRAASDALPMRDAFAVLFFVSVGMLLDPRQLVELAPLVLATLAVVILGKAAAAFVAVRLLRHPVRTAVTVAVALAQIGEFSFILGTLGRDAGILPEAAGQVLVATAILSITLNPLLYRLVDPVSRRFGSKTAAGTPRHVTEGHGPGAILVGYGPVGRTVARLLRENSVPTTVIELNHETVKELLDQGLHAVNGDASQPAILEHAGIRSAHTLIFAASGTPPEAVTAAARGLNPKVRILARSAYLSEVPATRRAGADVVVTAEAEVALAMAETLMIELGATPEQLDRIRARTRSELGESAASPSPPSGSATATSSELSLK